MATPKKIINNNLRNGLYDESKYLGLFFHDWPSSTWVPLNWRHRCHDASRYQRAQIYPHHRHPIFWNERYRCFYHILFSHGHTRIQRPIYWSVLPRVNRVWLTWMVFLMDPLKREAVTVSLPKTSRSILEIKLYDSIFQLEPRDKQQSNDRREPTPHVFMGATNGG